MEAIAHAYVLQPTDLAVYDESMVGGKAQQLAWLAHRGYTVPDWVVLSTSLCDHVMQASGAQEALARLLPDLPRDLGKLREVLYPVQERILAAMELPILKEAIEEVLRRGAWAPHRFFAVRSSVVGEDAPRASFAGQMDSFLFQQGAHAITRSVLGCIASAYGTRALSYRREKGLSLLDIRTAVIVQVMIEGDVSGVLFTAHPVTGSRQHALLTACYGLGEGIVSGRCNTDAFTVDLRDGSVVAQIRTKDEQVCFDLENGIGTCVVPVSAREQESPSLGPDQVQTIVRLGSSIAAQRKAPQDIEWTIQGDTLYVLQTRPITSLPPPSTTGAAIVWDNSNIQESYCGVTTPLTFSFARIAYATVYAQTMRVMHLPERVVQAYRPVLENLLGLIQGRIYYNINNWYRGLKLLPGFSKNKADMERMMGLQDPVDFVEDEHLPFFDKVRRLPLVVLTLVHLLIRFRMMDRRVRAFNSHFDAVYGRIDQGLLHTQTLDALVQLSQTLRQELLMRWSTPIINDFFVMMMNGQVRRVLERLGVSQPEALQNSLLAGEEGLESTAPTRWLVSMAAEIRHQPALETLFHTVPNNQLLSAMETVDADFHEQCHRYLDRYGDRGAGELKLETITPRQNPSLMLGYLKNFLARPDLTPEKLVHGEQQLRQKAERQAFALIRAQSGAWGLRQFKKDLARLRKAITYREHLRMARTRMFGLFRSIYLEIGGQLYGAGLLDSPRDVFYLTVAELDDYAGGTAVQTDLKAICRARKKEYARYEAESPPHHFATSGVPYYQNSYRYPYEADTGVSPGHTFDGIGCYPGVVEASVRVMFSVDEGASLDGQVLCTMRTDPGWAPLFPTAGGLLIERGSTLSHSAVIARELGIPAIVGIPAITKHLHTGDHVHLDGTTGRVRLLDGRKEGSAIDDIQPED